MRLYLRVLGALVFLLAASSTLLYSADIGDFLKGLPQRPGSGGAGAYSLRGSSYFSPARAGVAISSTTSTASSAVNKMVILNLPIAPPQ